LVWCGAQDSLGWDACPISWEDWKVKWVTGHLKIPKRIDLFIFAGFAWSLWINRNKMEIEGDFPGNPLKILYSGISFLQKWRLLLKPTDREEAMGVLKKLKTWVGMQRPKHVQVTDNEEL